MCFHSIVSMNYFLGVSEKMGTVNHLMSNPLISFLSRYWISRHTKSRYWISGCWKLKKLDIKDIRCFTNLKPFVRGLLLLECAYSAFLFGQYFWFITDFVWVLSYIIFTALCFMGHRGLNFRTFRGLLGGFYGFLRFYGAGSHLQLERQGNYAVRRHSRCCVSIFYFFG